MKACIVTVYNSANCGSFWQAYILGEYLKSKGVEVFYYKRKKIGTSSSFIKKTLRAFKHLLNEGIKSFNITIRSNIAYAKIEKKFSVITKRNIKNIDCFILGSDTIWNFEDKYFLKNNNTFLGTIFPSNKKIISYSASVANTSLDKIKSIENINKKMNKIDFISVRDLHSKEIVENFVKNKKLYIVYDPTLLLEKKDYKKYIGTELESNYIFIYLFDNLTENQINDLKKIAKEENLKIISGTKLFKWCDECIVNDPILFLRYIYYAKYVITDTFHGTIFSVNLNKDFVVIDRDKNKVNEFIKQISLEEKIINDNTKINEILKRKIDYSIINKVVEKGRKKSQDFLDGFIK